MLTAQGAERVEEALPQKGRREFSRRRELRIANCKIANCKLQIEKEKEKRESRTASVTIFNLQFAIRNLHSQFLRLRTHS
jgi:hypothetical protein